jgi:hypothetical protein
MLRRRIVPSFGPLKLPTVAPALLILVVFLRESVCFRSVLPSRRVGVPTDRRSPVVLQALSKSGAKLVESSDDFKSSVLQASTNRPVMVFYTAPW